MASSHQTVRQEDELPACGEAGRARAAARAGRCGGRRARAGAWGRRRGADDEAAGPAAEETGGGGPTT